jgi:hypothetical protein
MGSLQGSKLLNDQAGKMRKLLQLTAWQWVVLLGSVFILPLFYFRLRLGGFKKALDWTQPSDTVRSGLSVEDELALAKQTAFAVDVASKYGFWKPNCLTRSLALGWFLSRREIPFEIRIGVPGGKVNCLAPAFTAHAWVESSGVVLNDKEDVASEFSPFESELDKNS